MPSGSCRSLVELTSPVRRIIDESRRAVLATLDARGRPHALPVCFAVVGGELVTAVDQKPKSTRSLARLRNVAARPEATMLFDRWDEDWTRLGWVMVRGRARIEAPGYGAAELAARYEQYRSEPPAGEAIVLAPERVAWWLHG